MWELPDPNEAEPGQELLAVGGDLSVASLLGAYASGLFPMNVTIDSAQLEGFAKQSVIGWWSPDPRGVLNLQDLRISRSLKKSCRKFQITFDQSFEEVMRGCQSNRPDAWILDDYISAYSRLNEIGHAHSVEVRTSSGELVGGLYGVELGGFFAGESMFHSVPDASKVALVALVEQLKNAGPDGRLLDVQWKTPHLATLGVSEISRREYLARLQVAISKPPAFAYGD